MTSLPVIIVGGGLAGLNCARLLAAEGIDFLLLEASDGLGGRVRTDFVNGFRLDRGFQVFQTAYPEARRALDYERLQLRELEPGACVWRGGRWHRMSDPVRRPSQALATLFNGIGTFQDRLKLLRLRRDVSRVDAQALLTEADDLSTATLLRRDYGFSPEFIDCFMRPWLSGIFLESDLATSANFFRFVFKMLASGPIAYPQAGIQALADQLAESLTENQLRLGCPVASIDGQTVRLCSGDSLTAEHIVLATDATTTRQLLGCQPSQAEWNGTTCLYFQADQAPTPEKSLMLNGEQRGLVNHLFIPTNTLPDLAPAGKSLISVSTIGVSTLPEEALIATVIDELRAWFGECVDGWSHLRTYAIPHAVLQNLPGEQKMLSSRPRDGLIVCGDQTENSSVNGALRSGRLAAEFAISLQP